MRTPEELRALLDTIPRPLVVRGHIQIVGAVGTPQEQCYTVGIWQDAKEALWMLRYMLEEYPQ